MTLPRLDILLYAHDGRGLGHVSRTTGLAMALRRLFPGLRILLVTGSGRCGELIDRAPLDWLKLPSYQTRVIDGKSRGVDGNSNFSDQQLGELRSHSLKQVIELYRPRLVLADHAPQGKHRELLGAIAAAPETRWVLGVRGITGSVKQVQSPLAATVFQDHYCGLLWYGDSTVLGTAHRDQLSAQFNTNALETGYVSRFIELQHLRDYQQGKPGESRPPLAGTISIPWFGESGRRTAAAIARALRALGSEGGRWHIYLGQQNRQGKQPPAEELFTGLAHCRVRPFGQQYAWSLLRSRVALIYGGYNSLVDCLAAQVPAVVLLRNMQDNEQQLHLKYLADATGQLIALDEESVTADRLLSLWVQLFQGSGPSPPTLNLNGAAKGARYLASLL